VTKNEILDDHQDWEIFLKQSLSWFDKSAFQTGRGFETVTAEGTSALGDGKGDFQPT
jgi:hypothetical protein